MGGGADDRDGGDGRDGGGGDSDGGKMLGRVVMGQVG